GARGAERSGLLRRRPRPGAARPQGERGEPRDRVPALHVAEAARRRGRAALGGAGAAERAFPEASGGRRGAVQGKHGEAGRFGPDRSRRLVDGGEHPDQSRRDDHEGVTMPDDALQDLTRRHFFRQAGFGIGSIALSSLLERELRGQEASLNPMAPKRPHFAPRAKNIIYLFMMGAPSQLDLFDEKQKLRQYNDQPVPEEVIKGERFAFIKGVPKLLGSPYEFKRHGQSGATVSNLLPHL